MITKSQFRAAEAIAQDLDIELPALPWEYHGYGTKDYCGPTEFTLAYLAREIRDHGAMWNGGWAYHDVAELYEIFKQKKFSFILHNENLQHSI